MCASNQRNEQRLTSTTFSESGEAELPGMPATEEQIQMLETRYRFAAALAPGHNSAVLEVGAGAGQGIACLEAAYDRVVVGDVRPENVSLLEFARGRESTKVARFSSDEIPFPDSTFDTVLILEAIYYFEQPGRAIAESHRVLKPGGKLLLTVPNPDCTSFVPSRHALEYYSSEQLQSLLNLKFSSVEILAAFRSVSPLDSQQAIRIRKFAATVVGLLPGAETVRRILRSRLLGYSLEFPRNIEHGTLDMQLFIELKSGLASTEHKVLYTVSSK